MSVGGYLYVVAGLPLLGKQLHDPLVSAVIITIALSKPRGTLSCHIFRSSVIPDAF